MFLSIELINKLMHDCMDDNYVFDYHKFKNLIHEYKYVPITLHEAKVLIDEAVFKKDLGLNVVQLICSVLHNEVRDPIDIQIVNKNKLAAIKLYRTKHQCGLADAKYAVEAREKQLGLN